MGLSTRVKIEKLTPVFNKFNLYEFLSFYNKSIYLTTDKRTFSVTLLLEPDDRIPCVCAKHLQYKGPFKSNFNLSYDTLYQCMYFAWMFIGVIDQYYVHYPSNLVT